MGPLGRTWAHGRVHFDPLLDPLGSLTGLPWSHWVHFAHSRGPRCIHGFLCGISGRPSSMYMLCPHDIGRDSWDRGGQESVVDCNSPQELGEEALTERTRLRVETERPLSKLLLLLLLLLLLFGGREATNPSLLWKNSRSTAQAAV